MGEDDILWTSEILLLLLFPHRFPMDEFRENFEKLLNSGFVDVFRTLNPEKEGVYSWWGPKNKNRLENIPYVQAIGFLLERISVPA